MAVVNARGLENHVSASFVQDDWKVSLSGNYVFTVTTDESEEAEAQGIKGKQLIYIPRHHGNLFLNAQWKTWNASYTLEVTGVRKTSYSDDQYFLLDAYSLHHIAIGKQIDQFRLELRCNNLFNTDYHNVIWRAMPGRSFEVMVEFRY